MRDFTKAGLWAVVLSVAVCAAYPVRADDPVALRQALAAVGAKDWPGALQQARASGPLAFDIVEWHRLRAGQGSFADYADFSTRRADWPGMALLRRRGEANLSEATPGQIVTYFAANAPLTAAGAMALIDAHLAQGDTAKAQKVAAAAWRGLDLSAEEEAAFLTRFPTLLADHHGGRIAWLLDRGEATAAKRLLALATPGTRAVAAARIALQLGTGGVDALIAAVPERMAGSAGLARDRATWRGRNGAEDSAADLLLERSTAADALGEPALWARLRANLARRDLRMGEFRRAYKLAARHHLKAGADYADLEWLAGYAALRLNDAPTALLHFRHLGDAVSSPISLSRAGYWQGRALDDIGNAAEAQAAYASAARYQTTFYGLLAAERIAAPMDPQLIGQDPLPDWRGAAFAGDSRFQAAVLLHGAGRIDLTERFLLQLSEGMGTDDIARLARLALDWNDAHLALMLAKKAAEQGVVLTPAYLPLSGLETTHLGVPTELALSIARRESEFDPVVVSGAGARGLMQVMPGTAKMMAEKLGIGYELARLTSDPAYNAQLGAAYLATLRDEFGPSPVLVAAGYNAGPGRPRRWMAEQGDPRAEGVDVVDWIEMIPFSETRNYVMRVSECLPGYRARLSGKLSPIRFTEELKGR
ncbi:transglycosylase SLT domain-containing protein [Phaeovulum sp.]|uniref:lytic transglycosylase domain-containing protein n=1 Tax=Phaeovulum sp. TaxID=2934796 RepID=UPI0039E21584